jgi:hypothetical protein
MNGKEWPIEGQRRTPAAVDPIRKSSPVRGFRGNNGCLLGGKSKDDGTEVGRLAESLRTERTRKPKREPKVDTGTPPADGASGVVRHPHIFSEYFLQTEVRHGWRNPFPFGGSMNGLPKEAFPSSSGRPKGLTSPSLEL